MSANPLLFERETIDCPLCGEAGADLLFIARDRLVGMPGEFPVVRCQECAFVYLNPRPTAKALAGYYPTEYYPLDYRRETPEALSVARGLLARVQSIAPGTQMTILDAGCGTGLFLRMARDAGHEVHGIELSPSAVEYGHAVYGLPIECGTLESCDLPADTFDVITMWHVLEHVPEPLTALRMVQRLLKPGGTLLFGVPNIASLEARIFGRRWFSLDAPRHLIHFSPESARNAVEVARLSVDQIAHSSGTAGLVYSLMGDLTGVWLKLRGRQLPDTTYRWIAGALSWLTWPVCVAAARAGSGGALEVYARKPDSPAH